MPNYYQAKAVAAKKPLTETERAGSVFGNTSEFIVPAVALGVGDIIEFQGLPAYHMLETVTVLSDQVDSNGSPLITYDLDYLTGYPGDLVGLQAATRTMAATLNPGAAGVPLRVGGTLENTSVIMARQVASSLDRNLGLKVTAAAATQVAGARIRVRTRYSADPGMLT